MRWCTSRTRVSRWARSCSRSALFQLLQVRDVAHADDKVAHVAVRVGYRGHGDPGRKALAGLARNARAPLHIAPGGEGCGQIGGSGFMPCGAQKMGRAAQHLRQLVAGQTQEGLVGLQDQPIAVGDEHALLAFKGGGGNAQARGLQCALGHVGAQRQACRAENHHVRPVAKAMGGGQIGGKKARALVGAPQCLQSDQAHQPHGGQQAQPYASPTDQQEHPVGVGDGGNAFVLGVAEDQYPSNSCPQPGGKAFLDSPQWLG
jgi:hypothetical protein